MKNNRALLVIGGFLLGVAAFGQPYDWTNLAILASGIFLIVDHWKCKP